MRRAVAEAAAQQARVRQAQREAQARAQAERAVFASAVGPVQALRSGHGRVHHAPAQPAPLPVQRALDEQAVLRESLSDEFDVTTLLDVDDAMSFRRPGVGTDVTRKLRAGHWSIQAQLDLHGLRRDEARETLANFIREAHRQGIRCLRVVHGKGLGSPGKTPVLKAKVQGWLIQKNEVLAFVQAKASEGGAGALVVLLQPSANRQTGRTTG
ncbi:MAG: putative DNA endonuclease SmrA [Paracidovorax wautersii]|uniref:Putative DNA endonuclease SmrA n=1 Tax=Paracidovorax wautersii TaxID=1177982 RepID=A0A7V8FQ22_9BURK|nr:MAG: putative DNA endonuclease SmrA [Paracidovorax wautersii]